MVQRTSSRLAAATGAQTIQPIETPRPTKTRATKKSVAAKAAAEAVEKAAAEKAAVAEAALDKAVQKLASLRERQRQASARYYARKKGVIAQRRASEYAATTGAARAANPPKPRQSKPVPVVHTQAPTPEFYHEAEFQQYEEMPQHDIIAPQHGDGMAEQMYVAPPQRSRDKPIIRQPPVPASTELTKEFLAGWLDRRMPPTPIGEKKEPVHYASTLNKLFRILDCTDLRVALQEPDDVLHIIKSAIVAKRGKVEAHPYETNSKMKDVQLILILIREVPIAMSLENYNKYETSYSVSFMESTEKTAANRTNPDKSVMSYDAYSDKVLEKYGPDSKEYLIVRLYDEVPARDDFHSMEIVAPGSTLSKYRNYIEQPVSPTGRFKILLQKYKTVNRYNSDTIVLSEKLSNQIRTYMTLKGLTVGMHLLDRTRLSVVVGKMNKELGIIGKGAVNYVRHSIASTTDAQGTIEEKSKRSKQMYHSMITHGTYIRPIDNNEAVQSKKQPRKKKGEAAAAKKAASTKEPVRKRKRTGK